MKIQLKSWKIEEFNFLLLNNQEKRDRNDLDLGYGAHFPESNKKEFHIIFKINITDSEYNLKSIAIYVFEVDSDIDEVFKNSPFVSINAPAIAFPYLRAFLSNFTLQSGLRPIVLPSINFVEFSKNNKKIEAN